MEKLSMEIRPLTADDAALFWSLRLRALWDSPEAFGSSYDESVDTPVEEVAGRLRNEGRSPDNFVLAGFAGGEPAGLVGLAREQGRKMQHKAMIWGVWVAPEFRGQGIGRKLVEEAISRARSIAGLEQLHLTVVTANDAARHLYRSLGFEVYGLEPHALKVEGRYLDEELMVLHLS
jgi:ribosomal protein S18 acetylase RimI-like enzyme